jgi:8-oxo-dGTP diphosphatase
MNSPTIVCAAVIISGGRVLIVKRRSGSHGGGRWEFPGGKLEYGEDTIDCLVREIKEELGCSIRAESLYDVSSHIYPDGRHYVILFYRCAIVDGELKALEHEEVKWVKPSELKDYEFVGADKEVAAKLT